MWNKEVCSEGITIKSKADKYVRTIGNIEFCQDGMRKDNIKMEKPWREQW